MKYLLQDGLKIKNSRQDVKQILSCLQNLHITDAVNWLESNRRYNSAAKGDINGQNCLVKEHTQQASLQGTGKASQSCSCF